ncbi:hypothetical protein QQ020_20630 [Fulvivirgaceae bacterium BMA12]|uniref:Blue (type 1) copper domain-containing protein n=1 Tax=Agaribacillus aureus TaxID=3051825 RepID=A0ABT8L9R8_9BACT|nr:hypothetical protein [Fulvivirgaceae bacterium BMA12]
MLSAGCSPSPGYGRNGNNISANPAPQLHIIEIRQMKFFPDSLAVNKGDTVRFVNKDLVVHDVTEELKQTWTSSPLSTGKSWDLVITQNVAYFCSLHVVMKGKIVVKR